MNIKNGIYLYVYCNIFEIYVYVCVFYLFIVYIIYICSSYYYYFVFKWEIRVNNSTNNFRKIESLY